MLAHMSLKATNHIFNERFAPSLRWRYRVALLIEQMKLDPDNTIISGDDGFINYNVPRTEPAPVSVLGNISETATGLVEIPLTKEA
jgi:hypothetical protein